MISAFTRRANKTASQDVQQHVEKNEPDMILVFKIFYGVSGEGTRLAMPKTICAPDSSSWKPGSGATEGVMD